ncbi:MAG TPA: hypothetical protein VNL94_08815 [Candidatus Binatia bacterium]|nr:hypothetical protein [Candidatus Binatia bacterium]
MPHRSLRPETRAAVAQSGDGPLFARVAQLQTDLVTRVVDSAWNALHALGAHRWQDGWETDLEKGWSRYRGSRCTICDEPWEDW